MGKVYVRKNDTKLVQNRIKELQIFSANKRKLDVKHRSLIRLRLVIVLGAGEKTRAYV